MAILVGRRIGVRGSSVIKVTSHVQGALETETQNVVRYIDPTRRASQKDNIHSGEKVGQSTAFSEPTLPDSEK